MKVNFRKVLQYTISLGIAFSLLLYLFKGFDFSVIVDVFKKADYKWVILSIVIGFVSHLMRAYRWIILLKPLGYTPTLYKSFLAVMSGYFINLIIPRGGEVARSGLLQKMDNVPATKAFGTIVMERIIDVLILGILMMVLLAVEVDQITSILTNSMSSKFTGLQDKLYLLALAGGGFVILGAVAFYVFRKKIQQSFLYAKALEVLKKVLEGVSSILKVKNQGAFWFHTIGIWVMYYFMAYVLFQCFPVTADLNLWVGFSVLVVGALGMAAPVQGGLGTYHILITAILAFYLQSKNPPRDDVLGIVTFMHAAQSLVTIVLGGVALGLSSAMSRKQQEDNASLPKENTEENIKAVS